VIGGAIADGLAWQWIFWVNVPIGLLAVPFVLAKIPESRGTDRALDLPGLGLITLAAFGIVWGLVRGNAAGWGSAETVVSIVGGALLLAAFVVHERRTRTPMLPPALFEHRAFAAGNAAGFLMTAALFSAVFFFAQFLQTVLGHDPLGAGLRLLPWTATLFFVAPVAGALVDRHGERPFLVGGLALQAAGFAYIALADPEYLAMVPALMVAGAGISMALPATINAVVGAVAPPDIGKASGVISTLRELGGVFGIAITVAVFAGAGGYASFEGGFERAMLVAAGLSLAGAAAGLALPSRRSADRSVSLAESSIAA
jgi:MFS family permease